MYTQVQRPISYKAYLSVYYKKDEKKIAKENDTLSETHFEGQKIYESEGRPRDV